MVLADHRARYPEDQVLGRLVAGKLAVYGVLGLGGFGAVYRAIQEPVGREVALKVVHARHADDPELRARFFREARLVARLQDPAVVTLHDYGEEPGLGLYMVFELVRGTTLHALMRSGPQPAERVVDLMLQLLRALHEAHSQGMVHRDLKPANVMVVTTPTGEEAVRLLDFGIAKVVSKEDQEKSLETQRGLVMGTPRYLSPEQARASEDIDLRSDLYSLSVIAYTMLAGTNPFRRESVIETIMAHCTTPPPPLDPALGVSPALEAALLTGLEKDPADRYDSAETMAAALVDALPHASERSGRWAFRSASFTTGTQSVGTVPLGSAEASGASSVPPVSLGIGTGGGTPSTSPLAEPLDYPTPMGGSYSLRLDTPPARRRWPVAALGLLVLLAGGAVAWTLGSRSERAPVVTELRLPADDAKAEPEARLDPVDTAAAPEAEQIEKVERPELPRSVEVTRPAALPSGKDPAPVLSDRPVQLGRPTGRTRVRPMRRPRPKPVFDGAEPETPRRGLEVPEF